MVGKGDLREHVVRGSDVVMRVQHQTSPRSIHYLSIYVSMYLSNFLYLHPCLYLPIYLSIYLSLFIYVYIYICVEGEGDLRE